MNTMTSQLDINAFKSNISNGNIKLIGNVSIESLPQTNLTTNLGNAGGIEPSKSESNDDIQNIKQTNFTSLNNTQFPVTNLLSNNTSNSSSSFDLEYNQKPPVGSIPFELKNDYTLDNSTSNHQFTIPPRTLDDRSSFQGINILDSGNFYAPYNVQNNINGPPDVPDPQIAVSPSHIGEFVNVAGGFFTKNGELIRENVFNQGSPFSLDQFFKSGKNFLTDPRIIYDNSTARWLAFVLDATNKTVRIAVSNPGDPFRSNWNLYEQHFDGCPDQPSVGISKDKVVISANTVRDCVNDTTFLGSQFAVIDKADLLKGESKISKVYLSGQYGSFFSLVPAKLSNPNETSDLYLVKLGGGYTGGTGGIVTTIITISGKVPTPQELQIRDINFTISNSTRFINNVIPADMKASQLGIFTDSRTPGIDLGDARVQDASWHNGKIWFTANDKCKPTGDIDFHGCYRLIQIETKNNYNVSQDFDVSFPKKDLFFPSLAIDLEGNLGLIYSYSSINDDPGILAAIKFANSTNNTLDKSITIMKGISIANTARYGDYSGVVIDPSHPKQFWAVAEFIPVSSTAGRGTVPFWSTFIASFSSSS